MRRSWARNMLIYMQLHDMFETFEAQGPPSKNFIGLISRPTSFLVSGSRPIQLVWLYTPADGSHYGQNKNAGNYSHLNAK